MFIRYQKVRNTVVGTFAVIGAAIAAAFGFQSTKPTPKTHPVSSRIANRQSQNDIAKPNPSSRFSTATQSKVPNTHPSNHSSKLVNRQTNSQKRSAPARATKLYQQAFALVDLTADGSGKAKDILGASSPWKLNLYDENRDGQYERAKLDRNRDEVDDEKWNLKDGRWERSNGQEIWIGNRWVTLGDFSVANRLSTAERYLDAMNVVRRGTDAVESGKDILGASSPWKLNVYDVDRDGSWERAKLDKNRDDVDDEKWNFKNGAWEKNSGASVWIGKRWQSRSGAQSASQTSSERYQAIFQLIANGSKGTDKAKDILGSSSPWKMNLYDDDRDGNWDRGKLDKNRDEVDDEKWSFKNGRWEKNSGQLIWSGTRWSQATAQSRNVGDSSRYLQAFKLLQRGSSGAAKGKDILGSSSPWKLNVYDDNRDGKWDRAKLDKNRDDLDDEKWNFKKGRWEKDGGAAWWNGSNWSK